MSFEFRFNDECCDVPGTFLNFSKLFGAFCGAFWRQKQCSNSPTRSTMAAVALESYCSSMDPGYNQPR